MATHYALPIMADTSYCGAHPAKTDKLLGLISDLVASQVKLKSSRINSVLTRVVNVSSLYF